MIDKIIKFYIIFLRNKNTLTDLSLENQDKL